MRTSLWIRSILLGAAALAAGSTSGCAEERAPINKVQANALAKSFFVGADLKGSADDPEFYFQTTLVDVGYGAAQDGLFTSTYAQPLSRIKWQVTEDLLLARITYERVSDSDGKGAGPSANDGVIAAAYKIKGHFDIRRDYNPATGEESNIIVENSSDRTWDQREYFRVDWSENLATDSYDFDTLSLVGIYGGIQYEPLNYYVNDPRDPDAPHFDPESGYFDVTNKAFAKPGVIDLSSLGWGIDKFPACFLDGDFAGGNAPYGSCDPVELTLRQSFRKVPKTDFEPKNYDGYRFQSYGAFYEDRYGYARDYGMVDQKWHRLIDRYNIWERSHWYQNPAEMTGAVKCYVPTSACQDGSCVGTPYGADPNRDDNGDGQVDECASVGGGSYCDSLSQKCTLPYKDRVAKPIAWYYSDSSNQEYYEGTEWAAHEWDVAMRAAVMSAKYAECARGGGDCSAYPILRSQQDSNWDLIQLAKEVDNCRHQVKDAYGKVVHGGTNCEAVADSIGKARGYEPEVITLAKQPEMVVLCHSPVEANDPEICAPADKRLPEGVTAAQCSEARKSNNADLIATCDAALHVRMGDLRYNQVNALTAPQTPSPWGIMTDSEDPLTGEKIASSINVWTHVNELFSQGIIDQARYIKGELETAEITEGKYIKDWAAAAEAAGSHGSAGQMTKAQARARIAAVAGKDPPPQGGGQQGLVVSPAAVEKIRKTLQELKNVRAEISAPATKTPMINARLHALAGTEIEAELMTKPMQQLAGVDGMPLTDEIMDIASPLRGGNRSIQRQFERFKQNALSQRGACILSAEDAMSPAPLALADLSTVLEEKFGAFNPTDDKPTQQARAERMRKYIAQRAQYAVIIHEMGHSIGLRHNFVSSSDAYNYRSQYWQLRTKNGTVDTECTDLSTDGESCIGPRYFDPITDNEKKNLLWMFMQSSVMDYAGEITQDLIGLGAYDFAAARMFYGDAVAVYADPSYKVKTARGRGAIEKMDNFGGLLGFSPAIGNAKGTDYSDIHYSQIQKNFEVLAPNSCVEVDPANFKPADWDEERFGTFHPVLDGLMVSDANGKYTRCRQQPIDVVGWTSLRMPKKGAATEAGEFYRGGPSVDAQDRVRVPYGFATDRWADLGNAAVYRHDNGADVYELFDFFITQQEAGHIFDNYRRGRQTFTVRGAAGRALGRYNEKMRDGAKGLGLLVNIFKDLGIESGLKQQDIVDYALANFYAPNTLASGIAFDHFTRMMARPEAGEHILFNGDTILRPRSGFFSGSAGDAKTSLIVPNGATGYYGNVAFGGALLENSLSENNGEYDSEYTINAGSYYGKMYTTMLMTESEDNFISDSITDFYDSRYRSVSLADVFTEGYRRWLANSLTNDDQIRGVRVAAKATGAPDVDPELFPKSALGTTSWWPKAGPEVCFPNQNSIFCSAYGTPNSQPFSPQAPANTAIIDPLIGWEQQKFLIAWTYIYLPENQKRFWLDRMEIKELGKDVDPGWTSRIELHIPDGSTYIARTYGTETIFGKTVQKGVAARVLEYANELLSQAYDGSWVTGPDGVTQWFVAATNPTTGQPIVQFDPNMVGLNSQGQGVPPPAGCSSPADNMDCTCDYNRACSQLEKYKSVPWFMSRMGSWIEVKAKALYP